MSGADQAEGVGPSKSILKNSRGWDGKLRVGGAARLQHEEHGDSDEEEGSDDEAKPDPFEPEQIEADEDLLADYPLDTEDIDLVHRRVASIAALALDRFKHVERLCLRQNAISKIEFPDCIGATVVDVDLYDNLIGHLRGLENIPHLTSLDLSFNKLKHIKNIGHLTKLKDLYFVQNRISRIEGLDTLTQLRNLELGGNRLRQIENLDHLQNLEELWLGKNKITEIQNISHLSNLKIVSLPGNRLKRIDGIAALAQLEELYLSYNKITALEGVQHNPKLRVLDVSDNQVEHLEHLSELSKLEEFWASGNQITSFVEVERELGGTIALQTVYFEHNPLQTANSATYRNKVRLALPQVKQIDASRLARRHEMYLMLTQALSSS